MSTSKTGYLRSLGVFGFDQHEPIILSALVTEDPLLLIGASGTGKTFLLNSLSEALGLEHRHYNASLISFDDLVGFPFPDADNVGIKFLETPATVWGAESVLIDEISRCKPEHQNRLFSLVHERRVQGIGLPKLRYRWAAMNPAMGDQANEESYTGSEPLDPALADRFALFVKAVDWGDLTDNERLAVATPCGEGKLSNDGGRLLERVEGCRKRFNVQVQNCPHHILAYVTTAVTALNSAGVRISPRRARLMARSLLAVTLVQDGFDANTARLLLECSLPHLTWGAEISASAVDAAHRLALEAASDEMNSWLGRMFAENSLVRRLQVLLDLCPSQDQGTQAVGQLLATESKERAAAFAFAVYPAAVSGKLPIGSEGVNDLGRIASQVLTIDADVSWREHNPSSPPRHPGFAVFARALSKLSGARAQRARQFFSWCMVGGVVLQDPAGLENEINDCVKVLKKVVE